MWSDAVRGWGDGPQSSPREGLGQLNPSQPEARTQVHLERIIQARKLRQTTRLQTKQTRPGGAQVYTDEQAGHGAQLSSRQGGRGRRLTPGPSHQDRTSGGRSLCFRAGLSRDGPRSHLPVWPPERSVLVCVFKMSALPMRLSHLPPLKWSGMLQKKLNQG